MSVSEVSLAPVWSARAPRIRTWHLILFLVLISLVLNAAHREVVMTRGTYDVLLSANMDQTALDRQWAFYQRMSPWSYPASVAFLAVQLSVLTLLVQLGLVLAGVEVAYRRVWAATVVAQFAVAAQMAWTFAYQAGLDPAHFTATTFYRTPLPLAGLVPAASGAAGAAARSLNLFELVWAALLFWRLGTLDRVSTAKAAGVTAGLLLFLNALQVGITLYVERLGL